MFKTTLFPRLSRRLFNVFQKNTMTTTLFDDVVPPGVVNLRMGAPGNATLLRNAELIKNAAEKVMSEPDATNWLTYGAEFGASSFRTELAKFLTRQYKTPVDVDSLVQTAGATQGLSLLSSLIFAPGDLVFTERLSYFLALKVLSVGFRYKIKPVDFDQNGISPAALEEVIKSHFDSFKHWSETKPRPYWAMVYLMPTFHNPTGYCLSPENCEKIVALARKYSLLVVCDDVYDILYFPKFYPDGPPRRLITYDKMSDPSYEGNIVSVGTFSKLFGPGVRLGWLEAPQKVRDIFEKSCILRSGGAVNHMTSGLMTSIMKDGHLDEIVEFSRRLHQDRCQAVCSTLKSVVPSVEIDEPKGGYFVWFKLPNAFPLTSEEFSTLCIEEAKIGVFAGIISSPSPCKDDNQYIRISFAYYEKEELQSAVTKLGNLINKYIP